MKMMIPVVLIITLIAVGGWFLTSQSKNSSSKTAVNQLVTDISSSVTQTPTPTTTPAFVQNNLPLTITSPADKATVATAGIVVKGKTGAKAQVAVNDVETIADANGNFSVTVELDEGENSLFIIVNDSEGNVTEKELTVIYESGQ